MINAIIDGTTYTGIEKITTGGKTINLEQIGGEGLPEGIGEIKMGSWTQASNSGSDYSFAHGCTMTPDIVIIYSDFRTYYTETVKPSTTTLVGWHWNGITNKGCCAVSNSYTGTLNPSTNMANSLLSNDDGYISAVDATNVTINCASNRVLGAGLTYTWIAIVLDK